MLGEEVGAAIAFRALAAIAALRPKPIELRQPHRAPLFLRSRAPHPSKVGLRQVAVPGAGAIACGQDMALVGGRRPRFVVCDALRIQETSVKSFTQRSRIDKAFGTRAVVDGFCHAQFDRLWR